MAEDSAELKQYTGGRRPTAAKSVNAMHKTRAYTADWGMGPTGF